MFDQISGHSVAQSSWHLELTIAGSEESRGAELGWGEEGEGPPVMGTGRLRTLQNCLYYLLYLDCGASKVAYWPETSVIISLDHRTMMALVLYLEWSWISANTFEWIHIIGCLLYGAYCVLGTLSPVSCNVPNHLFKASSITISIYIKDTKT